MLEAARLSDPIGHTSALAGFIAGAVIGVALIAFAAATIFTGGLCVGVLAAFAGAVAPFMPAIGAAIGSMFSGPPTGTISSGSSNVFINHLPAARATLSTAVCAKDPGPLMVATGSASVLTNDHAAARRTDKITCGASISAGSGNVLIGDQPTAQEQDVADEIPPQLRKIVDTFFKVAEVILAVTGIAMLVRSVVKVGVRAMLPCAGKMIGGAAAGYLAGQAGERAAQNLAGQIGHPVDVITGRKLLHADDETDFVLPGRLDLVVQRFYASDLRTEGLLGRGWRMPWEIDLQRCEQGIRYTDAQGRHFVLPDLEPGQQAYIDAEHLFWTRLADGRRVLHTLDLFHFVFDDFDADGRARLLKIEDGCGAQINFTWHTGGLLHEVFNRSGQRLRLRYQPTAAQHGPRLREIEVVEGGTSGVAVSYEYDAAGQLTGVRNRLGELTRAFAYDNGLMIEHRNQAGLVCRYRWEIVAGVAGQARVVEHSDNLGAHYRFVYHTEQACTTVQQADGRQATWNYDEHRQVTGCLDFDGLHYGAQYDAHGNLLEVLLPGERRVQFVYDDFGRIVKHIDPLGRETRMAYHDRSDLPAIIHHPDGGHVGYRYDGRGLLLQRTDTLGQAERFEYDESGLLLAHQDAKGGERAFTYDARANLLAQVDCSGKRSIWTYDLDGAVTGHADAAGAHKAWQRDALGRIIRQIDADGGLWQVHYNAQGLPDVLIDPAGKPSRNEFMAGGLLVAQTDPMMHTTRYAYGPGGVLHTITNPNGACFRFAHDPVGRVLRETAFDGVVREFVHQHGLPVLERRIGIDPAQPPLERQLEFDACERLLRLVYHEAITEWTYDPGDRIVSITRNPTQSGAQRGIAPDTIRFEYDPLGRMTAEITGNGSIRTRYDALHQAEQQTLAFGQKVGWQRYGSGHVHGMSFNDNPLCDFERDDLHREVWRSQGHLQQHTGYDLAGRMLWRTAMEQEGWQAPATPRPITDPFAPEALLPQPYISAVKSGRIWQAWEYQSDGEVAAAHNRFFGSSRYQYDGAGGLRLAERDHFPAEQFSYDGAGNLRAPGAALHAGGRVENDRLMMWQDIRFKYDGFGNLIEKRKGSHFRQTFEYDAERRLIQAHTDGPQGPLTVRFAYDALGRRIEKRGQVFNELGQIEIRRTWFVWQGMRMVQEVSAAAANDAALTQTIHTVGNTVCTTVYDPVHAYVPLARIHARMGANGQVDTDQTVLYYHTDQLGTPLALTEASGKVRWAGRMRSWGALEAQQSEEPVAQPLRFQGQYADEETGLHYNTFRYYDPDVGRFINQDPIGLWGGDNFYRYAPNPTGWVDPWGWVNINAGDEGSVKVHAYAGPEVGGIEHSPLHVHMEDAGVEVRVLMEDYYKKGKLVGSPGEPLPGEPSLTKAMKKALKNNLKTYQQKAAKVFKTGSCG